MDAPPGEAGSVAGAGHHVHLRLTLTMWSAAANKCLYLQHRWLLPVFGVCHLTDKFPLLKLTLICLILYKLMMDSLAQ